METNTSILQKALYELKHLHGVTFQEATAQSEVHNLQKIVDGKIEPTPNSWWKLHRAFPEYIPEPQYKDGTKVYKNVTVDNHSHAAGKNMTVTNNHSHNLSAEEQTLINLLREKDQTHIYLRRSIAELIMREEPDK